MELSSLLLHDNIEREKKSFERKDEESSSKVSYLLWGFFSSESLFTEYRSLRVDEYMGV
jgi:hypothetical protein